MNIKVGVDKEFLDELKKLNSSLSELSKKEDFSCEDLTETFECFFETVKTRLNTTQVVEDEVSIVEHLESKGLNPFRSL